MSEQQPAPEAIELPSKFNRKQQAQIAARKAERPKRFRMIGTDGTYDVLHPTKGWRRFTPRRVRAAGMTEAKLFGQMAWWQGISAFEERVARG